MAANKIDRINREIEKTREKITEYQNKLKGWKHRKPKRRICRSSSLCAPCGFPPQSLLPCCPGAQSPA